MRENWMIWNKNMLRQRKEFEANRSTHIRWRHGTEGIIALSASQGIYPNVHLNIIIPNKHLPKR